MDIRKFWNSPDGYHFNFSGENQDYTWQTATTWPKHKKKHLKKPSLQKSPIK